MDLTPPPTLLDRAWQLAYRATFAVLLRWWRVRPRAHHGALVALYVDDALLLVRSSYRPEWSLPGGGVEHGETSAVAASRELREEIGLSVAISGTPIVVTGNWDGRNDTVDIYDLTLPTRPPMRLDNREVVGARFVHRTELPSLSLTGPVLAYLQARSALAHENGHPGG